MLHDICMMDYAMRNYNKGEVSLKMFTISKEKPYSIRKLCIYSERIM